MCREEASSFEKNRLCLCHTFILSQYLFLGSCFVKPDFDSSNLFQGQGVSQDLQFKGSYLGSRVLFRSLSDRVVPRVLGPWYRLLSLRIYLIYFLEDVRDVAQKMSPLICWKTLIICLNNFRVNYLPSS